MNNSNNSINPYYIEKTCAIIRKFIEDNKQFSINIVNMRHELAISASIPGNTHQMVRILPTKNGILLLKEVKNFLFMLRNCTLHDLQKESA
jgi:hypothetical protein